MLVSVCLRAELATGESFFDGFVKSYLSCPLLLNAIMAVWFFKGNLSLSLSVLGSLLSKENL